MRDKPRMPAHRALAFVLALWLLLAPGYAALAATNTAFWVREDGDNTPYVQSIAAAGDALYLLSNEKLYRYRPGEQEPSVIVEKVYASQWLGESGAKEDVLNVSYLFAMDGCLYGFGIRTGTVTRLTDESGAVIQERVCTLDIGSIRNENFYISQVFSAGGKLYFLVDGQGMQLHEYALADGAVPVTRDATNLLYMTSYQEGFLAGITSPHTDENDPAPLIVRYELATGKWETLCKAATEDYAFGLAYDANADAFYYGMDSRVYKCAPGAEAAVPVAYLPERGSSMAFLEQAGQAVVQASSGIYLRSLSMEDVSGQVLIIEGEYGSQEHMAVVREHPEMVISPNSDYLSDLQALTTAMVSGESAMDVLLLYPEYQPVESLIDKGYAADLSAYPEIMEIVDQMDPRFLEPFRRNGGLYAVPVYESIQTVSVNRKGWTEELGLSLDDLPKTYPELLDFIANYSYDYGDDHPDVALTDSWDLRSDLLALLLQSEAVYQTSEGVDGFSFDTPRFHKLLKALDSIDYSDISLSEVLGMNATDDDYNEYYSKTQLLSLYYGVRGPSSCSEDSSVIPLVLSLDDGMEPVLPASLSVLLLNPKSLHPELAATYIASYLRHLDASTSGVTFFPERNDDVPNPSYETTLQQIREWLEQQQKALEAASPENRASLAEDVEQAKAVLANAEKARYLTTTEEIMTYREKIGAYLMPLSNSAVIATGSGNADTSIRTLLEQYAKRAIDADTFIRELNNRIRLKMLENQ